MAEILIESGDSVPDACTKTGLSVRTFYRLRSRTDSHDMAIDALILALKQRRVVLTTRINRLQSWKRSQRTRSMKLGKEREALDGSNS